MLPWKRIPLKYNIYSSFVNKTVIVQIMPILNIYSNNVKYLYRVRLCSLTAFVVLIAVIFTILIPFVFVYQSGGYWMRSRTYYEKPNVHFKYKYFLLIERDNFAPLICSTFSYYKDNLIKDDCNLVKVEEVDNDEDGFQDSLSFEMLFYSNNSIRSLILLLFFNYELKENILINVEAMSVIEYTVGYEVQELYLTGDLILRQKNLLRQNEIYYLEDNSTDLNVLTLSELFKENKNRLLSGEITNLRIMPQLGFVKDEPTVIKTEIFYAIQCINYQPGLWEEIKWAWMQYLSILVIVIYIVRKILTPMFVSKRLRSYIVVPWDKNK